MAIKELEDDKKIDTQAEPVVTAPVVDPGNVTMSKEAFDALMERLKSVEDTQNLQLTILNKNDSNKIDEMRRAGKLVKSVKVRKIDGKWIIGWKTLENDVFMQEGRLIERQTLEVFFKDETKKVMNLREWAVTPAFVSCEVTAENKDAEGNLTFKVRSPEGEEFDIGLSFVN